MTEAKKLTEDQERIANKIAIAFTTILFGEDYKKSSFIQRILKAFLNGEHYYFEFFFWYLFIVEGATFGYERLVLEIFAIYLGFAVTWRIFHEVGGAVYETLFDPSHENK